MRLSNSLVMLYDLSLINLTSEPHSHVLKVLVFTCVRNSCVAEKHSVRTADTIQAAVAGIKGVSSKCAKYVAMPASRLGMYTYHTRYVYYDT